ncbi:MAG: hypothetical protein ACYS8L_10410 [Planctomycetota bacterium]|jgi:hypothetical protein
MHSEGEEKGARKHRDYVGVAVRRYGFTKCQEAAARLHFDDVTESAGARELSIPAPTYKGRIQAVYAKMNVHTKAQFVKKTMEAWFDENMSNAATDSF